MRPASTFSIIQLSNSRLPTESWKEGWIVWVIAAVLFPAVIAIANAIENNRRK